MKTVKDKVYLNCQEVAERLAGTVLYEQWTANDTRIWAEGMGDEHVQQFGVFYDQQDHDYYFEQTAIDQMIHALRSSPSY